jgi:flagellin
MATMSILNNIPALAAENQLDMTQFNLNQTLEQLSSGSRINSGADDPAGLAIADGLQANVTALTQSALNANEGVGELQVADGALSQVTTLLNRAVTLATESANGTVSDGSQREALDAEFQSIKSEIDSIGTNTTYNGSTIFSGGSTNYNQIAAANSPAGLATTVSGTLTIKSTGGADIYTTSASDTTVGQVINEINSSGTGLVAALDSSGHLFITDAENRGTEAANELEADATTGSFTIGSDQSETFTNTTNSSTMNVFLSDSTSEGSSTIGVTLGQFSSSNMNGISLANDDLLSASSSETALTDINNAIAQVAALRGSIGAGVNRLEAASNVMSNQTQNLSSAEDGIQAADITQTVANLTKYQILSQTGISALAQANQMQQNVLKLLQ